MAFYYYSSLPGIRVKWLVKLVTDSSTPGGQVMVYCRCDSAELLVGVNQLKTFHNEELKQKGIDLEDLENPAAMPGTSENAENDAEWALEEEEESEELDTHAGRKRQKRAVSRVPCSKEENEEIQKHFQRYIQLETRRPCTGMKEILHICAKSKASEGAIWKRHWKTIKYFVSYLVQKNQQN